MSDKITAYTLTEIGIATHVRGRISDESQPSYAYVRGLAQWYAIERGGSAPGWFAISRATVRHDIAWRCQYLAQRVARDDTLAHRFGDAAVLRLGLVATVDAIEQALMTLSDFATEQHLASRTLQQVVSDYGETRPHMPDGRPVDLEERRRRLVES